ncbi:MAG: acylneuraminate cytidylyltransferase family protein [Gammaproteobacteria bacterium]|nr:acylneuraminate cytidylyltransferase family protein [Gammaproteobacteria bacterium]
MKTLCVIAARGGSQGVPGKNVRMLLGKPVIVWAINKAKSVLEIDRVVVSTDSEAIADVARTAGAEVPFIRPVSLATSDAGKFQVWQHALASCEEIYKEKYQYFVDVDCTNPLLDSEDISAAIAMFKTVYDRGVDAIFTISPARRNPYFNLVEANETGALKMSKSYGDVVLSRQKAPLVYEHVAGVYVMSSEYLRNANHLLEGHAEGYVVPESKAMDIDSEFDFQIIEYLMRTQCTSSTERDL